MLSYSDTLSYESNGRTLSDYNIQTESTLQGDGFNVLLADVAGGAEVHYVHDSASVPSTSAAQAQAQWQAVSQLHYTALPITDFIELLLRDAHLDPGRLAPTITHLIHPIHQCPRPSPPIQ